MATGTVDGILTLLQNLGVLTIGAGVLVFISRKAISQYFSKELVEYQAEVDKEINRYQSELEKERLKFSELHSKRAEIAAELYKRFVVFESDMLSMTDPVTVKGEQSKDGKIQKASESGNEFLNYYMKHKIYFPEEICVTVEEINSKMDSVFNRFRIMRPDKPSPPSSPPDLDTWMESWETVSKEEVPELKTELEDHFRDLLGVELQEEQGVEADQSTE